ncbi:SulP family inorganic anion transporter, partial [Streptococcus pneumoniae]|uniref:SulP family inorganic anion transporter n=1 Tax=Streptococcus pneumoniae TaxID=1313 RepID=UPI0013E96753
GALPDALPALGLPDVPLTWETLWLILPFSIGMAFVGLLESLLTAKLVDDITDTRSDKTRESWGQGVANVVSGLFGGMGGCAVVIPMAALVGVMMFVAAATFDWHSVRPATLRAMPRSETAVMVVTVAATV